jgi:hypothetical protein
MSGQKRTRRAVGTSNHRRVYAMARLVGGSQLLITPAKDGLIVRGTIPIALLCIAIARTESCPSGEPIAIHPYVGYRTNQVSLECAVNRIHN